MDIIFALQSNQKETVGDFVYYRNCFLFPEGTYADKENFAITASDLLNECSATEPVKLEVTHDPNHPIDENKIGGFENKHLRVVDGKSVLFGDVKIHRWLDPLLKEGVKLSAKWDKETKRLSRVALLMNPYFTEAALTSAYAKFNEEENMTIEEIMEGVKKVFLEVKEAEKTPADPPKEDDKPTLPANFKVEETPEFKSLMSQVEDLKKQVAFSTKDTEDMKKKSLIQQATEKADEIIRTGKEVAANRDSLVAMFHQALSDDAVNQTEVAFGAAKYESRFQTLVKMYESREPMFSHEEMVAHENRVLSFGSEGTKGSAPDADRIKSLLGQTPMGMALIPKIGEGK